ncbi:MAG: insulinase family protein [Sphingobacteriales bacterium]|nr:MAG: insulinase family protein [Sphingobacteriales bacterium]
MNFDRTIEPKLKAIEKIELLPVNTISFTNGLTAHIINAGEQDVIKLELVFKAGRMHENAKGVAVAVSQLLRDGTNKRSSKEISETFDFYGASISTQAFIDTSSVSLYTLNKHLSKLLPLLKEVLTDAVFPQRELETYIQNNKQKLLVNLEKVEFLSQRKFTSSLFGENHPIGYTTNENDLNNLNTDLLKQFYSSRFQPQYCTAIISGRVTDETIKLIEEYFGKDLISDNKIATLSTEISPLDGNEFYEFKTDAVQSAIRIGKRFINRRHADYHKVKVMNMIFGGYFGSRLMSNLREDKGYCYGVYSSVASFLNDAYLCIAAEVNADSTADAVTQIKNELNLLCTDKVSDEELKLVKNYIMGTILSDTDGPFNVSEIVKHLVVYDLELNEFQKGITEMMSTTSDDILQLANKYFVPSTMNDVIVGKK